MSDPDLELDDDLPPTLRRLLHDGAEGPAMSRAAEERVMGRVLATVGAATVTAAAAGLPGSASGGGLWGQVGVGLKLLTASPRNSVRAST